MILHDQHVHSSYSEDSQASLRIYYNTAKKAGCSYFITTEHVDLDHTHTHKDWLADFDSLETNLKALEEKGGPKTLLGVEIGYQSDKLDELVKIINSHDFDLINLSVHDSGFSDYYYKKYFLKYGTRYLLHLYYEQLLDAAKTFPNYQVLSHLDYGYKSAYLVDNKIKFNEELDIIKEILKVIIEKGKALEINTKVQRILGMDHLKELLMIYKSLGGTKLTISSDAHKTKRYLEHFDECADVVKELGFVKLSYFIKQKEYYYDL